MSIHSEIFFANKPVGISTHSPDRGIRGFVEYLAQQSGSKRYVCHRLDKATSGAMVFAKTAECAAIISKLFEEHKVQKTYVFVTDKNPKLPNDIVVQSEISKVGSSFVSKESEHPNSESRFQKKERLGEYAVWKVTPKSGKPHQIRLHAESLGIPILGDMVHGGTLFPRLMLHAHKISFQYAEEWYHHTSSLPDSFQSHKILADKTLVEYLSSMDRRMLLFDLDSTTTNSYRLIHNECRDLRCDLFGEYLWFYWYKEKLPTKSDLHRFDLLASRLEVRGWKVQLMKDRGEHPEGVPGHSTILVEGWECLENKTRYLMKHHQGASPGLFLDQRQNRFWVQNNSREKKVLNVFCYTAGFSVCAAQGGAKEVVSVDTSKATIQWARDNFTLNNIDPEQFEFWATDARQFIRGAVKRGRKFDVIICDPPSFARSKKGIFQIEKEFDDLVSTLFDLLEAQGRLLLSTNFEKWSYETFIARLEKLHLKGACITPTPEADMDFELPGEESVMKSVFICRE